MPNIRAQIVGPLDALGGQYVGAEGLHITASDGRSITLTRQQILANYQSQTGNAAARKAKCIDWAKQQIVAAIGAEQLDALLIDLDFNTVDGKLSRLEVR